MQIIHTEQPVLTTNMGEEVTNFLKNDLNKQIINKLEFHTVYIINTIYFSFYVSLLFKNKDSNNYFFFNENFPMPFG